MSRYRKAKKNYLRRQRISALMERLFVWGTEVIYGPDGFKRHGPTHLIADMFYVDCHVCIWWRGFIIGIFALAFPALCLVAFSIYIWL